MTRVLVIGGGIAGTAAALALHKAGHEVTVHEAHSGTAEDLGAFLTPAGNGMRAPAQPGAPRAGAAASPVQRQDEAPHHQLAWDTPLSDPVGDQDQRRAPTRP
ncbi:FAD-dependent oxidoreductase [Streptomyces sp. TG1A-8]|nr:FAD-dependent oxidoreductase [Streptomyces sp. TG1A-8]MDO0924454.1 FAD-dependent oxidoreductase [Streptomyces sp. TG1A-8]